MDGRRVAEEVIWRVSPGHMAAYLTSLDIQRPSGDDPDWDEQDGLTASTSYQLYPHTDLLSRKFREAALLPNRRIIIEVGPRYGKSVLYSQWGPAWFLELFPDKRVILASYGHDLALHNARSCRNILVAHQRLLAARLARDASAADQWNIEGHRGGLKAAGVGGALTGFGADLALVDDPFKDWAEAQSQNQRDKVWDWFRSVLLTRLHKGASCVVLATRWHRDDLSGRLIALDDERERQGKGRIWEVVRLPTIADAESRGEVDPLGREDGEVLCPELFPTDQVMAQREELGDLIFGAMHQQNPTDPEGSILLREWWRRFDGRPEPQTLYGWTMSCDLAFKDTSKSDWVVLQVWARDGAGNHYLLDQVRGRFSYVRTKDEITRLWSRWPLISRLLIEDTANGPAVISELGSKIPGIMPITPRGSKESRVHAITPMVRTGFVWLPTESLCPWVKGLVDESAEFPNGTHDDQVDALSQYLNATGGGPMSALTGSYAYSATKR